MTTPENILPALANLLSAPGVLSTLSNTCPDCGVVGGGVVHGTPGDATVAGFVCTVLMACRMLDPAEADPREPIAPEFVRQCLLDAAARLVAGLA